VTRTDPAAPGRLAAVRTRLGADLAAPPPTGLPRRTLRSEVLLLLAVSVGASAIWAALSLARRLLAPGGLRASQATLNGSYAPNQPWLDLLFQLVDIGLGVVPALFALHLLARDRVPAAALGLDRTRPRADLGRGMLLAAVIGIPGLLLYLAAHALGLSATVVPSALPDVWWRIPVLVLSAAMNATVEEVVVVGYLVTRLRQLGRGPGWAVGAAALLRGSYHLYQGFGGFVGNAVMGVLFGWFFLRTRRVLPLVIAHTLLDTVAFVGYTALSGHVSWLP
jgi:membrane protease YdiL (CAAX protease family)